MRPSLKLALVLLGGALAPVCAHAHAFLDHAVPGVGATVGAAPSELELTFTQDVVPSLSGVRVNATAGGAVGVSKPAGQGSVLRVRFTHPLSAGTYVVNWHVVSVDTHPTSGTFKFTVGP